jgi:hypothetical protein
VFLLQPDLSINSKFGYLVWHCKPEGAPDCNAKLIPSVISKLLMPDVLTIGHAYQDLAIRLSFLGTAVVIK